VHCEGTALIIKHDVTRACIYALICIRNLGRIFERLRPGTNVITSTVELGYNVIKGT
jgi:hypothetical protein